MGSFSAAGLRSGKAFALVVACAALLPAAAMAEDWKFSSSVNYATGKYGTTDRVDSLYVPFTLKRYYTNADISVTIPYVRQSSVGQVIWVGGNPVHATKTRTVAATSEQSGLGDIMLRGSYALNREDPRSFDLGLAGSLKLPTADENKGLGTGQPDAGAGLEFSKELGPNWTMLADAYYTVIGEPAGADFNNRLSLDLGFTKLLREHLYLTVLFEAQSAIVAGNEPPRSLSGSLAYGAPDATQFSGGLTLGLSDGSPQIGLSAGLSRRF